MFNKKIFWLKTWKNKAQEEGAASLSVTDSDGDWSV
jgi:hypothetical protein